MTNQLGRCYLPSFIHRFFRGGFPDGRNHSQVDFRLHPCRQIVDADLSKLDTMRWSGILQRIHVTLAIYVTRTQFEGIQDRSSANTFFRTVQLSSAKEGLLWKM